MANSMDDLHGKMTRLSVRAEAGVNRKVRKIAIAILSEVTVMTPVDTGRARANWLVGLDGPPDDGNINPYATGRGGNTAMANATMAIESGKAAVSDREPGQDIYISNNLPYIGALNNGSSAQAPAGFVERAVQYGVAIGRGEKVLD